MDPRVRRWERQFRHAAWADAELVRALREHPLEGERAERAARILAHLVAAECLWLRRLGASAPEAAVWPGWTLDEAAERLAELERAWRALVGGLDEHALRRTISYATSKGTPWTSRVDDVLDHVLLHGAHHRGQLAMLLRDAGHVPPTVDLALAARQGSLD